jgi:hypothetical protein
MVASAGDYLTTTRAVLAEARTVQGLLVADPDAAELALDDLVAAATRQDATGDVALRFTAAEPLEPAGEAPETTEELLAGALVELHVASVLMATGHAADEGGPPGDQELMARAVNELAGTLEALDRERAGSGRLGFVAAAPAPRQSPDAETAIARLRADVDAMLGAVMKRSAEVITELVGELGKLLPDRVSEAMARIGGELDSLPKLGRIVRIGLRKLEKVLNLLSRLISVDVGDWVRVQLQRLWDHARSGELVVTFLDNVLDVEGARRYVQNALETTSADTVRIHLAADEHRWRRARGRWRAWSCPRRAGR